MLHKLDSLVLYGVVCYQMGCSWAPAGFFSSGGQIRRYGAFVPKRGPETELRWGLGKRMFRKNA